MIELTVGMPNLDVPQKTFQVYRGALCHYSGYFKTMLNSGFQEGGSEHLELDAVDPQVFQMFYDFMNTGDLVLDGKSNWKVIVNAHIFADYHLAQEFKNKVMDLYFASIVGTYTLPTSITQPLYRGTSEQSPLRKFHVDVCVAAGNPKSLIGTE